VTIKLIDVSGRLISTDRLDIVAPGKQEYLGSTAGLTGGTYFIRIETDSFVAMQKLLVS